MAGHNYESICKPLEKISRVKLSQGNNQHNGDNEQGECWPDAMIDRKTPADYRECDCRQDNDWQRHESEPKGLMVKREPEVFRVWLIWRRPMPQVQTSTHNEQVKQRQPRERVRGQNHW